PRSLHDPAAENDALGRQGADPVRKAKGEIVGFEHPGRMIDRQVARWFTPSLLNRGTRGEPFQAVAMKWTATRIAVLLPIMRDSNMPHFGVNQAVQELPIHDDAATDSGPNGEVEEVRNRLRSSPTCFAQGGCVHVRVEADRYIKCRANPSDEIKVLPANLGSRSDVAKGWRGRTQVDRAKRTDTNRLQLSVAPLA